MAVEYHVVHNTLPVGGNGDTVDFTVTGAGDCKAAIFLSSNARVTNNPENNMVGTVGFWDRTNGHCIAWNSFDNRSSSDSARENVSGTRVQEFTDFIGYNASNITDGVRLTVVNDSSSYQRHCIALLFYGDVSAQVGTVSIPNATTASVSGSSVDPDCIFFISAANADDNVATSATHTFGVCNADLDQGMSHGTCLDNLSTSSTTTSLHDNKIASQYLSSEDYNVSVTNVASDGFTISSDGDAQTDVLHYMMLDLGGLNVDVQAFSSPTSTSGSQTITTGFDVGAILSLQNYATTKNSYTSDDTAYSYGATDLTNQRCVGGYSSNGLSTTDSESHYDSSNLISLRNDGGTVCEGTYDSKSSTSFDLDWTTADTSSRQGLSIAFEAFSESTSTICSSCQHTAKIRTAGDGNVVAPAGSFNAQKHRAGTAMRFPQYRHRPSARLLGRN